MTASSAPRPPTLQRSHEQGLVAPRRAAVVAVAFFSVTGAWWFVLSQANGRLPTPATVVTRSLGFLGDLLGASTDTAPAYTTFEAWRWIGELVGDTLVMSVLAMGVAGVGMLLTLAPASRRIMIGDAGADRRVFARSALVLVRGTHAILRGVPELIWAMLIVFVLRPGILAGALALALHETGVLGRLASDVVDDLDVHPLRSLRSAGAGSGQLLAYGALPQVLPQLITFLLYRWEVVIRATVVVGFITGAGLGHALRLSLSFRRWTEVALILLAYVLLVWLVEIAAMSLRRLAR